MLIRNTLKMQINQHYNFTSDISGISLLNEIPQICCFFSIFERRIPLKFVDFANALVGML